MSIVKLDFAPTLVKDVTALSAKGNWTAMQWMRPHLGYFEDIPGYQSASLVNLVTGTDTYVVATDGTIPGICRRLHAWADTSAVPYLAAATHKKLAVLYGGGLYDITPFRGTSTYSNPFIVSSGSPIVTVNIGTLTHGGSDDDTVVFSGAGTVGGIVVAGPYVMDVLSGTSFQITAASTATAAGTGGGTSVVAEYELAIGNQNGLGGPGYGVGGHGLGFFGVSSATVAYPRTWSLDNFGQYLLANPRSGLIYQWQLNTGVRAQPLANAPSQTTYMFVTAEGFIVAAGTHDGVNFVPMLLRWSGQRQDTTWTPAVTNQAGDYTLSEGSRIVAGLSTKSESLIFTDTAVYAMRYLSDPSLVYGFVLLAKGCGLIGPNAVCVVGANVYWLSNNGQFWIYDGGQPRAMADCPIIKYVFDAITPAQQEKIYLCRNGLNNEMWCLYPADDDAECSNYAALSTEEGGWFAGTIARTAMVDAGVDQYPVMAGTDSKLYIHEIGRSADGGPLNAYIECAPFDLAEGGLLMEVLGYIPDFKDQAGVIELTVKTREYPQSPDEEDGPYMIGTSGVRIDPRASGRQGSIRLERNDATGRLRLGVQRFDVQPLGERP